MAKISNVFARVEPEIKEQAEMVLEKLGIPMSNAINIFLRQIILNNGLPFELKLSQSRLLSYGDLSREQFDIEIDKGIQNITSDRVMPAQSVAERMGRKYDV